ncbi:MAG: TonB C-terminal domain-containing protein [Bryobacterales bacterium]|nr:TonB C-terminal domain-containing protein [Bryobacterales bacterium]
MLSIQLEESSALSHLAQEDSPESVARRRWGLIISSAIHAVVVPLLGLITIGGQPLRNSPEIVLPRVAVTPLVAPRLRQLTQKAPNTGTVSSEINLESLLPRPKIEQAPGARPQPRSMAALPPQQVAAGPKSSDLIEAPHIDAPVHPMPQAPLAALGSTPAPPVTAAPAPTQAKPEIRFERPGTVTGIPSGQAQITVPNASVSEAIRIASQGRGSGGGGQVVEDFSPPGPAGGLSSKATRSRGSVELLSDPNGVDFKPYLIQVLAAVKRNWFAVMPESARFGRRGQVRIQFAINRDGGVPKLVIAGSSGFEAFDRAAVAGVSASNPFPPLPREFQGGEVRLQFTFSYNIDN